jgi:hypothetical protein
MNELNEQSLSIQDTLNVFKTILASNRSLTPARRRGWVVFATSMRFT